MTAQEITATRARFDAGPVLTDSGLETDLVFHGGFDLPCFAAFVLLDDDGRQALRRYFREHARVAAAAGVPFLYETPTWRASPDWGARLGYDLERLAEADRRAVALVREVAAEVSPAPPSLVSGCVGPRGDGDVPEQTMTADEAQACSAWQIGVLADAGVDLVTVMT